MLSKRVLFILLILFSFILVSAQSERFEFFPYYDENVFTAKRIFSPFIAKEVFSIVLFDSPLVIKEEIEKPLEVLIKKTYLDPKEIKVKVGQLVTWKNDRSEMQALLFGMREIHEMKSGFLDPGESFTWNFSKPGKYEYVDAIVIGTSGKIVVEE